MISLFPVALSAQNILLNYDIVICALGYESRARHIAKSLNISGRLKMALAFGDFKIHGYEANLDYFTTSGFEICEWTDVAFYSAIETKVDDFLSEFDGEEVSICLDTSSFSRYRMACLLDLIVDIAKRRSVRLHVMYSIATFSSPDRNDVPIRTAAPVTRNYAGWSAKLELPTVAIVGLGFEHGRALGAVEYLQADEIWVFDPFSPIAEYRDALVTANASLLEAVPNSKKLNYDVMNPHDLFVRLESLVYGLVKESRPVILPFGPKIFTLVAMLVAKLHPQLAVWRVSGGEPDDPSDREASGNCVFVEFLVGEKPLGGLYG